MLSYIWSLLNVVFGGSVDSVIADITHKVDKLKRLEAQLVAKARKHEEDARILFKKADDHVFEAGRAGIVAGKLRALVA